MVSFSCMVWQMLKMLDLRIMLEVQNSVDRAGAVRVGTKESESGSGEHQVLSALNTRPGRLLILALIYGGENMSK